MCPYFVGVKMAATGHALRKCCQAVLNIQRSTHPAVCSRCLSLYSAGGSASPLSLAPAATRSQLDVRLAQMQVRNMSGKKGFISELIDNVRSEMTKNKEMKENLKKFREEAKKLDESDALQKAREKYQAIESETVKGSEVFKKKFESLQEKVKETMTEAEKSEYGKKGKEFMDDIASKASKAAETVSKQGAEVSQTKIFKQVSEGVKTVKTEIDEVAFSKGRLYKSPEKLRKRDEGSYKPDEQKPVEANEEATGMVMHKDSQWAQSWQNFKDNNQYVHKMFDLKTKYDESDHVLIRATRTVTDKLTDMFGGVFAKTEMSEVLTEITKMDPNFDKEQFILDCKYDIIPHVLEAILRGESELLKDWCHEACFNVLNQPIQRAKEIGCKFDSKILDIHNVDIVAGKMMEQGPVLVISFTAQQIMVVRGTKGNVVEGDPEKVLRVFHVWALCRDQTIVDPKAAWRVVDLSSTPAEQFI